jgi:predicted hotdog family 3-hydroxylacyl-ACP dehydratase
VTDGQRGRDWLATHLPHRGPMNLLESVARWDEASIDCLAVSHRDPAHPLRARGELPVAAGIEYAAQAVAAHGALRSADGAPLGAGFLASVRSVAFHARRLDDVATPLEIHAELIGGDPSGVLYEFRIMSDARALLEGRVAVVLDATRRPLAGITP